ncbi:hypothetical protein Q8A67_020281 [Cirrhinus molitorella]|uniref:Uncharacterized protein n=1 Tax=Cirrhinus molitorella TaxID=172907 RepID=A0AA88TF87_9TELE|nr:hypothetical protein Q8A67_020281 [Cirrhinus molitorella]
MIPLRSAHRSGFISRLPCGSAIDPGQGQAQYEGLPSLCLFLSLSFSDQSDSLVGLQGLIALPELKQLTVAVIAVQMGQIAPFGLNLPFHYPSAPLGMNISMLLMTSDLSPSGHGGEKQGLFMVTLILASTGMSP